MTLQDQVYGPQTYQIEKLLLKIKSLTPEQTKNLGAACDAARDATCALVVRDLIGEKFTQEHYDLLTKPWRDVIGEFEEPEDEVVTENKFTFDRMSVSWSDDFTKQIIGLKTSKIITIAEARYLLGLEK